MVICLLLETCCNVMRSWCHQEKSVPLSVVCIVLLCWTSLSLLGMHADTLLRQSSTLVASVTRSLVHSKRLYWPGKTSGRICCSNGNDAKSQRYTLTINDWSKNYNSFHVWIWYGLVKNESSDTERKTNKIPVLFFFVVCLLLSRQSLCSSIVFIMSSEKVKCLFCCCSDEVFEEGRSHTEACKAKGKTKKNSCFRKCSYFVL